MASTSRSKQDRGVGAFWAVAVATALAAVSFCLGLRALTRHQLVNWDGLYATTAAYTVIHASGRPSLSLIGYSHPPLCSLLLVPLAAIAPSWFTGALAQVILGAATMFLGAWWLVGWMCRLGLPGWIGALLALATFLHPLVISLYAGGSPAAVFMTLQLVGMAYLIDWARRLRLRDLIGSSLCLGLAALADHFGLLVLAGAVAAVTVRAAVAVRLPQNQARPAAPAQPPSSALPRAEGTALFFLLLPAYLIGLWLLASWAIMGDPWLSLRHWAESATGVAPTELLFAATLACGGWLGALVLALAIGRAQARMSTWVVAASIAVAAALLLAGGGRSSVGASWDWAALAPAALAVKTGAIVLLALVLADAVRHGWRWLQASAWRLLGIGALLAGAWLSVSAGLGGGWPAKPAELMSGRIGVAGDLGPAREAAQLVQSILATQPQHIRVGVWLGEPTEFAVGLLAGSPWRVTSAAAPVRAGDYHVVLATPGSGDEYPLQTAWHHVRPVFVRREGRFAVYRFEAKPEGHPANQPQ